MVAWGHQTPPKAFASRLSGLGAEGRHQPPGLRTLASYLISQPRLPVCEVGMLSPSPGCPREQRTAAVVRGPSTSSWTPAAQEGQLLERKQPCTLQAPEHTTSRRPQKARLWAASGRADLPAVQWQQRYKQKVPSTGCLQGLAVSVTVPLLSPLWKCVCVLSAAEGTSKKNPLVSMDHVSLSMAP